MGPSLSLMLFFPLAISCLSVIESPIRCASNNTACDVHGNNLIDSFTGIESIVGCRQLCDDADECEFLTYYGGNGFPLKYICQLFNSCDETLSCSECVSETKGCNSLCSKNIVGAIGENMLDFIPNIESEGECRELCGEKSGCEYYTYTVRAKSRLRDTITQT